MRGTLNLVVVSLGLAFAACGGSSASDGGTSGGTNGGGTTGGGGDVTSACTGYCSHALVCTTGISSSQATAACMSSCSNLASQMNGYTCSDATGFFNCLAVLPCADYTGLLDGGGNFTTDVTNCATSHGCS
jgi:hypothetical protein